MRGCAPTTPDQVIAEIARNAHGVVTRKALRQAGLSPDQIDRRLRRGSLIRVHCAVYRVGHASRSREASYLAAVLACGDGAALAGRAAANLWGIIRGSPPRPEVLVPGRRRVPGITIRRTRHLNPRDLTHRLVIPVTTVPRTLVDLASSLPVPALARACHEADVLYGTTPAQVEAVLGRRPSSPGAASLRRVLHGDERVTLSRLESSFLARLREAALPLPETNRPAGGRRVDCRWSQQRLTVELDGYRYHRSRHAWEQDRRREREARARGDEFRRYTHGDVVEDPRLMLAELKELLQPHDAGPPR